MSPVPAFVIALVMVMPAFLLPPGLPRLPFVMFSASFQMLGWMAYSGVIA